MHLHSCRYCRHEFVCGENADECYKRFIVCDDCFWTVEVKHFILAFVLASIAVGMTLLLFYLRRD